VDAIANTAKNVYFLTKTGRPYKFTDKRILQPFERNRMLTIIPIEPKDKKVGWELHKIFISKALKIGECRSIPVRKINSDTILWNESNELELVLTPNKIFTQSSYTGKLSNEILAKVQCYAAQTVKILAEEEAAIASKKTINNLL